MLKLIKRLAFKSGFQDRLSYRRFKMIDHLMNGLILKPHSKPINILDVGCSVGKDFVKYLDGREDVNIIGLDILPAIIPQDNFTMVVGDGSNIPFPDKYFDFSVSIGVLEHIVPIEKLAQMVKEIDRTSKTYVVIVPSIGTLIEPHVARFYWHLKDRNKKIQFNKLIYMNDEAWMSFDGFKSASTSRFWHIPLLISNLVIYKE